MFGPSRFKVLLMVCLTVLIAGGCRFHGKNNIAPPAEKGVLDLTASPLEEYGPVALDGQWEFFRNNFIYHGSFPEQPGRVPVYINVPSIWNSRDTGLEPFSPYGFATYRLTVKTRSAERRLGVKLLSFSSAYRLYANGELIASNGQAGETRGDTKSQHLPNAAFFTVPGDDDIKTVELVCHVSNFDHPKGGFWQTAFFGTADQILKMRERAVEREMFFIGIFIIIGIFQIVLYLLRREDGYTLFFGLICFVTAVRAGLVGENLVVSFFPGIDWVWKVKIEMLTFYIISPLFTSYFLRFYKGYFSALFDRICRYVSFILIALLVFTPYSFSYRFMNVNTAMIIIFFFYIFYVLFRSYENFRLENTIFIIGSVVLFSIAFHDILLVNQVIYGFPLFNIGLTVFLLSQSFMISIQSARAHKTAETLSISLEQKVIERTEELSVERNRLIERNGIIEQDLAMARTIQMSLIPSESIYDFISFCYKPMDMVGGDFFDFIYFRHSGNIGVFISDVSGHGVPAAFITSMVKTVVLESGGRRHDPAALLSRINDLVLNNTGGNFITAFYGIFNPLTMELLYCNAGHPEPYIIYPGRVEKLIPGAKMMPLGITCSTDLGKNYGRNFVNEKISLEGCKKVLLYTDGLTEAINAVRHPAVDHSDPNFRLMDFGSVRLAGLLEDAGGLPPGDFVDAIMSGLIEFRGKDKFEDDICIVCIDMEKFITREPGRSASG